jgi:hypothetical protein
MPYLLTDNFVNNVLHSRMEYTSPPSSTNFGSPLSMPVSPVYTPTSRPVTPDPQLLFEALYGRDSLKSPKPPSTPSPPPVSNPVSGYRLDPSASPLGSVINLIFSAPLIPSSLAISTLAEPPMICESDSTAPNTDFKSDGSEMDVDEFEYQVHDFSDLMDVEMEDDG